MLDSVECSPANTNNKKMESSAVGGVKTFFCIHRGNIKVSSRYVMLMADSMEDWTTFFEVYRTL